MSHELTRYFCPECGSPIYTASPVAAVAALRETLDVSASEAKRGAVNPNGGVKGATGTSAAVLAMAVVRRAKGAAVLVYDASAETPTSDRHASSNSAAPDSRRLSMLPNVRSQARCA
jgi:hypothetical protein